MQPEFLDFVLEKGGVVLKSEIELFQIAPPSFPVDQSKIAKLKKPFEKTVVSVNSKENRHQIAPKKSENLIKNDTKKEYIYKFRKCQKI